MVKKVIDNISVDCVIFGFDEDSLKTLFVRRNTDPGKGLMALPGGFVYEGEELVVAPTRRLKELTGIEVVYQQEVGAFGSVSRYPSRRVFSIGYFALVKPSDFTLKHGPDAKEVGWIHIKQIPKLVFDHKEIFDVAYKKLQHLVRTEPIGFNLLPEQFTLSQIQDLYEAILDTRFDKRNFRKKLLKMNLLVDSNQKQQNVSHRAAKLYSFDLGRYNELKRKGFVFDL